jgi:hypothetical protein
MHLPLCCCSVPSRAPAPIFVAAPRRRSRPRAARRSYGTAPTPAARRRRARRPPRCCRAPRRRAVAAHCRRFRPRTGAVAAAATPR